MFELFFIFLNGLNDLQYTNNSSSTPPPPPHNKQMYKQMDGWMDGVNCCHAVCLMLCINE